MPSERLQKILAAAGVASRRAAERMIAEGRVRVNGRIVKELGNKADPRRDKVEVDGRRIVAEQPAYYLLHKPREMVTTLSDPEGRPTVADIVKRHIPERVFPVGRLDYHTSGALLLTNDGDMAQALLHPRKKVPKTYIAKFKGALSLKNLEALREGVVLDGGEKTGKAELFVVNVEHGNTWVQITITEGKNRQVHRMGEAIGHRVMRLSRVSFAGLTTQELRPGEFRPLSGSELAKLKRDYLNPSQKAKFEEARSRRRAMMAGAADGGAFEVEEEEEGAGESAGAGAGESAGAGAGERAGAGARAGAGSEAREGAGERGRRERGRERLGEREGGEQREQRAIVPPSSDLRNRGARGARVLAQRLAERERKEAREAQSARKGARGSQRTRRDTRGAQPPRKDERGAQSPRKDARGAQPPRKQGWGAQPPRKDARGPQRPREDARGPQRPREDARGAQPPRKDARGPQPPRKDARGPERDRDRNEEASRGARPPVRGRAKRGKNG